MAGFPSKEDIHRFLADAPHGRTAHDLRVKFAIEPSREDAFLRYLDNLVFHGELVATAGDHFAIADVAAWSTPAQESKLAHAGKKSMTPGRRTTSVRPESVPANRPRSTAPQVTKGRKAQSEELPELPGFNEAKEAPHKFSKSLGKKGLPEKIAKKSAKEPIPVRGGEIEGALTVNARGFGFVAATGQDIFVLAENLNGAMHGDTVRVRISGRSPRGAEGIITSVLKRGIVRVAGTLRRKGKSAWLEPDDARVRGPIVLVSAADTKAGEGNSGNDGDAAVVRITRHPEMPNENPEGEILQVLGKPGTLSAETMKILLVAGIDETHSDTAILEASAYGVEVPKEMLVGREDLTHIPLPTIDPQDARDHDDAVWVEHADNGGYRVWIAIADVSTYVSPGTKLDEEALARGCSVYLPDRAVPMLPRALSSNLCSLLPNVIRLCLCVEAEIDSSGRVQDYQIVRGFMKSRAKLTYEGVARTLGLSQIPARDPAADAMIANLRAAQELSKILRANRMKRGALDFEVPEPKIVWSPDKTPDDVQKRSQDPGIKKAYQLIEELMLLANELVAEWLVSKNLPAVFRVHLPPDEKKLERLAAMCEVLGVPFDIEETRDPKKLADLAKRFGQHEKAQVLHTLLLRSMKQATYDIDNRGHFGLASTAYVHFTSPIRRYPDVVVHRLVHATLAGNRFKLRPGETEKLRDAAVLSSAAERKSMQVERDVLDLYRCEVMKKHIGERFTANVTAIVGRGVFATLDSPFVDVMVRFEDFGPGNYAPDDTGLRVVDSRSGDGIAIGESLVVDILDARLQERTVYARRVLPDGQRFTPRAQSRPGGRHGGGSHAKSGRFGKSDDKRGGGESRDSQGKRGGSKRDDRNGGKHPKASEGAKKQGFPKNSSRLRKGKKRRK